jgi:hypothetical protein
MPRLFLALFVVWLPAFAQFDPATAHVNLYFPHLADGGTRAQQWQTSFVFMNPHTEAPAQVSLWVFSNDGSPLPLDLGLGLTSNVSFSIPPSGIRILRSNVASEGIVTGWAFASATLPVQATVLFRAIQNGTPLVEISAAAALPAPIYWSAANKSLGVAIANASAEPGASIQAFLDAYDSNGAKVGSAQYTLGPLAHASFTLGSVMPNLPNDFSGSLQISTRNSYDPLVAWTLNSDRGLLASLPAGQLAWPISHNDRIRLVWSKVLNAAKTALITSGANMSTPPVTLRILSGSDEINAYASRDGQTVFITLSLSELISDSPSELAFVIGHELGHIAQARAGHNLFISDNYELDADRIGMMLSLLAGYDPYAGAGALAKLSMAADSGSLARQLIEDLTDVHRSFNTRIAAMFSLLRDVCSSPDASGACESYKSIVHPHFPRFVPLVR